MTDDELIQKYLAEAKLATCTIGWVVRQDLIERVVQEFKKLYPSIEHKITMDWDDDTLLWLRFTWKVGELNPAYKKPASVVLPPPVSTTVVVPPTPRPKSARYGGPRW